jgi:ATP-dependent DNA helicase RecG
MPKRTISAMLDFLSPVSLIPGMGPKRLDAFNESGIETLGDLLYYFPRKYIDRTVITPCSDAADFINNTCTVSGTVETIRVEKGSRGRLRVLIKDSSGSIELLWFQGVQFFSKSIKKDSHIIATGKVGKFGHIQMVHPMIETVNNPSQLTGSILPVYSISTVMKEAGIQQKLLGKMVQWTLKNLKHYPQVLPDLIERQKSFPPLAECLYKIHFPDNLRALDTFLLRIKYEELYRLAINLRLSKRKFELPGRRLHAGSLSEKFRALLPFPLTEEQNKAITILYKDSQTDKRMHRLLQGDVGSGKTVVAMFSCLPALNDGFQIAWLTPTEVLARQTYNLLSHFFSQLGFTTELLKGGLAPSKKKTILGDIESGAIRCIVGTHAIIQSSVKFKNPGMFVIDEQHKFGAAQRLSLQEKDLAADFLLMSATPIPQTLAKTLYGDLEIVTLEKGPAGRLPVSTHIVPETKRYAMEEFVLGQIQKENTQVYYVVPRIEKDDDFENAPVKDVETTFKALTHGVFSSTPAAFLHGKMSADEKEKIMDNFASGISKLLVATSVIEVGLDIPNATIIIIENAERFGLAQLHQLRGRVGRGSKKSFCFLLSSKSTDEKAIERLSIFCKHHDGFKIAEMDLEFRGPGQITGFKQSGWDDLLMADIVKDAPIFREIQQNLDIILQR